MGVLDRLRAAGWRAIAERDNVLAKKARAVNDRLGRPLAPDDELADRKAFEQGYKAGDAPAAPAPAAKAPAASTATSGIATAAPVLVYFLDKQRRDVPRLTEILELHQIPYKTMTLEDDPAALAAVRRDSHGFRLPVVFIAGDCVGGRVELINLAASGELKKKVFGA
jgi:glutaredoxin